MEPSLIAPAIQRQLRADGVCVLTFDRPDSTANIFDDATLEELDGHLSAIAEPGLGARGVVLISAKPAIFIAGADLRSMQRLNREGVERFIALGQNVFHRLAALPMPTIAAIHGAAVGGGLEVALACDWRIASPEKATRIGLPETQLGILPAWGGSTRLPRLIGLAPALDLILSGKTLTAKAALKKGVIDALAPHEHLLQAALELLSKGKRRSAWARSPAALRVAGAVIGPKARSAVLKKTRGHYPAALKAVEVVVQAAAASSPEASSKIERDAILELAGTPIALNLMRLFFLRERAKKLAIPDGGAVVKAACAAVIGAGVMGASIAQWLSARGLRVLLRDVDASRVASGMASIARSYDSGMKRHTFTAREARDGLSRISPTSEEVPMPRVDVVIEAAVEKMNVKKSIFQRLDQVVGQDSILATNTSALSITELAAATAHPRRVIGLHFFNPVQQMQLVEVIVGRETAPPMAQRAVSFVQQIGKLPVLVRDSPGFIVNRILLPYMIEAAHLFWNGSSLRDIDDAMLDFGMPMGPLRLTDEVGVDVAEDVARTLVAAFPERLRLPEILPRMIDAGMLGKKTGSGFYQNEQPSLEAMKLRPRSGQLLSPPELERRMVLLMVNEAARCLEEKIVESADDIDFAMVMGAGFAPFRGGPLRYADAVGASVLRAEMEQLASTAGPQFSPCALITELAQRNGRFHEN